MSEGQRWYRKGLRSKQYEFRTQPGAGIEGCEQDRRNKLIENKQNPGRILDCQVDQCRFKTDRVCAGMVARRDAAMKKLSESENGSLD